MRPVILIRRDAEWKALERELGVTVQFGSILTPIGMLQGILQKSPSGLQTTLHVAQSGIQALLNAEPAEPAPKAPEPDGEPIRIEELISLEDLPEEFRKMPSDEDLLLAATPFFETESEKAAKAKAAEEAAKADTEATT